MTIYIYILVYIYAHGRIGDPVGTSSVFLPFLSSRLFEVGWGHVNVPYNLHTLWMLSNTGVGGV